MTIELWAAYVVAVFTLMIVPGPSQLLILSTSLRNGVRRSCATAVGDLMANTIQMLVASFGLVGVLFASPASFAIVKWLGVAYLIYLGGKMILENRREEARETMPQQGLTQLFWVGFLTSISNPKAIAFFVALFPQFTGPGKNVFVQLGILVSTYLLMDALFLLIYAKFAEAISNRMAAASGNRLNQCSGYLLITSAILLSLVNIKHS